MDTMSSPMVRAVAEGCTDPGMQLRAQADTDAVEALVAEAVGISEATDASRDRLRAIVRQVDVFVGPWRTNFGSKPLVDWHEAQRRTLYLTAIRLFGVTTGALIAPRPAEALQPGTPILPSLRWVRVGRN